MQYGAMKKLILTSLWMIAATFVFAATIQVNPGKGTLSVAIASAHAGDELLLAEGTYTETSSIKPSVPLTIKSNAGARLMMSSRFEIKAATGFIGLQFVAQTATEAIRLVPGTEPYDVTVDGCAFEGPFSRAVRVYNTDQTVPYVRTLTIHDDIFHVDEDAKVINAEALEKQVGSLSVTSCTFDGGTGGGYFIYLQTGNSELVQNVTVSHCTFYNSLKTRAIYLADVNGSIIQDCIFMNAEYNESNKSYCIYGKKSIVKNSISYQADAYIRSGSTSDKLYTTNPHFVNASEGNFMLYRNSIAVGASLDNVNMGDQRWGVKNEDSPKGDEPYKPYKNPYSMCPTTNSVKILWQMNDEMAACEGRVVYGTDPNHLDQTVTTSEGWNVEGEGYVHIVTLTGLQPNTRYYFNVGDKERLMKDFTGQTRTAPEAGTAFRLFTISDIHGNSCSNWSNMQDNICDLDPNICVMIGDIVADNGADRNWNSYFFTPGQKFLSQVPVMSAIGNHETGVPQTYRWSSFYDYFHQFSHGTETDPIKDPRGEAYFMFHYGNVDIICFDDNAEPSSPSLKKGDPMWQWMDATLAASTAKWIFVFSHVGIHTSGYHGQWEDGQTVWGSLFEKYAAQGKRIISFTGDDHSFEHLYKDGVHYLRPGCGRNSNYAQQTQLKDAQYSMFYRQISCYSTLDMAADASTITLTARDSAHNVFYTYTFNHDNEVVKPSMTFMAPDKNMATADSVMVQWFVFDPNKDALVNIYASQDPNLTTVDGLTPIATNMDSKTKRIYWNVHTVTPQGVYYLYGTISSQGKTALVKNPMAITVEKDTIAPPAPSNMTGDIRVGKYFISWENPTHNVPLSKPLSDGTNTEQFSISDDDHSTATVSCEDGAVKVDYTIGASWEQVSADYVFEQPLDARQICTLQFRIKGNGSSTNLRFICKNKAGLAEDWWFTESVSLNSKTWKDITLDLTSALAAFDWHANSEDKNSCEGLVSLCFAISTGSVCTGTFYLDDITLTGQILPASDFEKTIIRRSEVGYPLSVIDGDAVYEGTAENCTDDTADVSKLYYYAAFAGDDCGNWSAPAASAQWLSSNLNPKAGLDEQNKNNTSCIKKLIDGQLVIFHDGAVFDAIGARL